MSTGFASSRLPRLALLLLSTVPATAAAQTDDPSQSQGRHTDLGIGVRFGSLGFGLEASKLLTGHLGARVGANFFKHTTTKTQSDISYDATLKLKAFTALVDVFPSQRGSFHLTGGLITDPAKVDAVGQPSTAGEFKINGNTYTTAEVGILHGTGKFPGVSPYLGLGWGTPARGAHPLSFLFDLGVALGKAKVNLTSTGAATNPALASDLEAQEKDTQHDIDDYTKVYPVLELGLAYRF